MSCGVVVVGAGVAGLSAAAHLHAAGISVVVVEARERVGGRVHTVQHQGAVLELGAQWIHGGCAANAIYNLANTHDLLGQKKKIFDVSKEDIGGYFYTSTGKVLPEDACKKGTQFFGEILNEAESLYEDKEKTEDINLDTFYWGKVQEKLKDFAHDEDDPVGLCLGSFINSFKEYICDDLSRASAKLYGSSVELPGGDIVVPGGMLTILKKLEEQIPNTSIKLGQKVILVDWSNTSEVKISTEKGMSYLADYVILTLPLGVLKQNHQQIFNPGLGPEKIGAIERLGAGRVSKIFAEWSSPWWIEGDGGVQLAWTKAEIQEAKMPHQWFRSIFNFSEVEGQRNLLIFWVSGEATSVVDSLPDSEILSTITGVLRQFTGDPSLPAPVRLLRHAWTLDPLCLGAYSYPTIHTKESDYLSMSLPLPSSCSPRVLFAGEATHPSYWSFLHGARLAGIREADRVIQAIKSKQKM